jgi:dihydrolipoamide dehydrogenase
MEIFDIVIIGGGPGGYVAAVRARQLGLKTAVIEKEQLGGVCVNWGCIPTKALLRNAEVIHLLSQGRAFGFKTGDLYVDYAVAHKRSRQASKRQGRRVQELLKKYEVEVFNGTGRLKSPNEVVILPEEKIIHASNVIVATGAKPRQLPGINVDGENIITFRKALDLTRIPLSAVIIGAGPIGMEFATIWRRYGADVTIVEMMPRVLPLEDEEISLEAAHQYKRSGIKMLTGARVEQAAVTSTGVELTVKTGDESSIVAAEKVLVAIGFAPNTDDLGLEDIGVRLERGAVAVDDTMRSNMDNIFAIGDVNGKMGLAHVASAQGMIAAEAIAGRGPRPLDYINIPRCTYSYPEVASVGMTEQQARDAGFDVIMQKSPLVPNGKALAMDENIGFIKLVAEAGEGKILGAHMIGAHVTELIAGPTAMIAQGATIDQMANVVYPHPTISEAVMEGIHGLAGHAIHL